MLFVLCLWFWFVREMDGSHASKGEENRNGRHKIEEERDKLDACIRKNNPLHQNIEAKGRSMHLVWKLTPKDKKQELTHSTLAP